MRWLRFGKIAALAALPALAGCDLVELAAPARFQEDFEFTRPLNPGGRLAVENSNGSIEIQVWDEDEAQIRGVKFASSKKLLDLIEIDVAGSGDFVRVRTVKPSGRFGSMGARYTIRVPHGAVLDPLITTNGTITVTGDVGGVRARTSNGRVKIAGASGDVEIQTSNGSITCTEIEGDARLSTSNGAIRVDGLKGRLRAKTSNGSVKARIEPGPGPEPIEIRTSNGAISLTLQAPPAADVIVTTSNASITVRAPESLRARLRLRSTNGAVSADFEVAGAGERSKRRLEGLVNGGGPLVELTTTNGTVRLLKLGPETQAEEL